MNEKIIKYWLNIYIVALLLLALFLFINSITKEKETSIEGLEQNTENIQTGADSFCALYKGSSGKLNDACGRLTNKKCNSTSCCLLSNDICVAGNKTDGPTFNTDKNGKSINF